MTQSIFRAMVSRFPVPIPSSARAHSPRTRLLAASGPGVSAKSLALARYSRWMSSGVADAHAQPPQPGGVRRPTSSGDSCRLPARVQTTLYSCLSPKARWSTWPG